MTAQKNPNQGLPANAPTVTKSYVPGVGETTTKEWNGERTDVLAKYDQLKLEAEGGATTDGNTTEISYASRTGRAALIARFETNTTVNTYGNNTKMVEELYAIDIVRDVRSAPYWTTEAATKLTDDQIADVTDAVDRTLQEADITNWGAWTDSQKELRYHMLHGQESYFETAFILRRSLYGVITSQVKASFTNINTVVTAPTFESQMDALIESLPSGEWLYKPPQAEHLGKGKWRITQEWHWAEKWSKIYGGTWGL